MPSGAGMAWNGIQPARIWNGMEWNRNWKGRMNEGRKEEWKEGRKEWNGMEWKEWNGRKEWNGMEWNGVSSRRKAYKDGVVAVAVSRRDPGQAGRFVLPQERKV